MFLKNWTWSANTILLNTVGQPFSNLDPNPIDLSLRREDITIKVLMCQYIKAYLLKPMLKLYLILHTTYINKINWNSCAHQPTSSIIKGLLLLGSLSYITIHCVHYARMMVWQGFNEKFSFQFLFICLAVMEYYNVPGTVHRPKTCGNRTKLAFKEEETWSTSKFFKNLQS